MDRQRARPLHRAVAPAGHTVAAPGVGKPEVLWEANENGVRDVKWKAPCHIFITPRGSSLPASLSRRPMCSRFCPSAPVPLLHPAAGRGAQPERLQIPLARLKKRDPDELRGEKAKGAYGEGMKKLEVTSTNLSALLEDGRAGGGAALGGAQQPTGTQQPQPGGGEVAGGDLELAGVSPAQSCPCRSGCR